MDAWIGVAEQGEHICKATAQQLTTADLGVTKTNMINLYLAISKDNWAYFNPM